MKTKLSILFLFGFLLLQSTVSAQGFIGFKTGVNLPGFPDPIVEEGYTTRLGAAMGLDFSYRFNEVIGVRAMLEYSEMDRQRNAFQGFHIPFYFRDFFTEVAGYDVAYADINATIKDKYLLLPVMLELGWNFNEKRTFNGTREEYLRAYVSAGGFVGYFAESGQRIRALKSDVYADPDRNELIITREAAREKGFKRAKSYVTNNYDRLTYGVTGYIGFAYHFFYRNEVFIELGGNYGLVNLDKDELNGEIFTRSATVNIGYKWQF